MYEHAMRRVQAMYLTAKGEMGENEETGQLSNLGLCGATVGVRGEGNAFFIQIQVENA